MLGQEATCELVRSKGWLRQTPVAFQSAVLDRCILEKFTPGTPVYAVGDEPGGMFGIVTGAPGVSVASANQGV